MLDRRFAFMLAAGERPGATMTVGLIVGARVAGSLSAYATSKAGLAHLTRALALEWAAHDIRVNALAPGYIATSSPPKPAGA